MVSKKGHKSVQMSILIRFNLPFYNFQRRWIAANNFYSWLLSIYRVPYIMLMKIIVKFNLYLHNSMKNLCLFSFLLAKNGIWAHELFSFSTLYDRKKTQHNFFFCIRSTVPTTLWASFSSSSRSLSTVVNFMVVNFRFLWTFPAVKVKVICFCQHNLNLLQAQCCLSHCIFCITPNFFSLSWNFEFTSM